MSTQIWLAYPHLFLKVLCSFSGLAYSCLDKFDQISVLMNLDDSNQDNPKVPSAVQIGLPGGRVIWGNDAQGAPQSIEWFKLLLVDEDDLPEEVRTSGHVLKARDCLRELGKNPEEVIGVYLRSLWSHCLQKVKIEVSEASKSFFVLSCARKNLQTRSLLGQKFANSPSYKAVDNSRFRVVVTLPAIWPDYAKQRMVQAVQAAGILDPRMSVADTILTFVSEPEAAALATLKRVDGRCDIEDEDCFVVCDCGGGTVDLIGYQVISTEPMAIREIVKGTGK